MVPSFVLLCLVLSAGFSRELGGWGAALLAGLSVWWLAVNGTVEGVVLIEFSAAHGISGADLTGIAGLGLAAFRGASVFLRRAES
jgi:predicted cobalt transporter CbtA